MHARRAVALALALSCRPLLAATSPVTLQGTQLALRQVLEQLGRQTNRCFVGSPTNDTAAMARTFDIDWRGVSLQTALRQLGELTGWTIARTDRFTYRAVPARQARPPGVEQAVGDWVARFMSLHYLLAADYLPAEPQSLTTRATMSWVFAIEAPDDDQALRLLPVSKAEAETMEGQRLPAQVATYAAGVPQAEMPDQCSLQCYLPMPETKAELLAKVSFELSLAAGVRLLRLTLPALAKGATVTADGCTATIVDAQLEGPRPGLMLTCALAEGPALEPLMVEGRLYGRDGELMPTHTAGRGATGSPRPVARYQCAPLPRRWVGDTAPGFRTPEPARLELLVTLRDGAATAQRVTFEQVPLPSRRPIRREP